MVFYELSRTVRCCLPLGGDIESAIRQPRANTFAAWPSMVGLGLYVELVVCCRREADPVTGFVVSIADVDEAVRSAALPVIAAALRSGAAADAVHLLGEVTSAVACRLGDSVRSVTWNLTPHYHVTMEPADMTRVRLAQQFEFAAAHRLHNPQLDEETNRRVYGKCTNPNGHGHNYRLQVVASRPVDDGPSPFSLQELERIVEPSSPR
ncbi:MAG: 6-carboxytetrahydropterin synthase [Planctomycetota bacterium]|jgi:6-pyruvoyltetrahydropterin/6-carboxytetrahydropterin synthase